MVSTVKLFPILIGLLSLFMLPAVLWADDCWLSVSGSGAKNGTSALNAYSALSGKHSAQHCWEQTSAGGTMHVLEGEYTAENKAFWRLKIDSKHSGSASEKNLKRVLGEGRVVLRGSRKVPYEASKEMGGESWITLTQGAGRIAVQNFQVSRVSEGIKAEGNNHHLEFQEIHFEDTRQNFVIMGHPRCKSRRDCPVKPEDLSDDVLIQNTSGLRYSKRHVRLGNGVSKVRVMDSHADGGFLDGDFAVGFDVENPSHDIEFKRCSSRANIYTLSPYWNGDGFKAENETHNIRWTDCSAFDNADAGFDIKTENPVLENIVALRNNRNIRIWSSQKGTVKNANASYAEHRGGEGAAAGIWSSGVLECRFCTLHDNTVQIMAESNGKNNFSRVQLYDSILSADAKTESNPILQEEGSKVDLIRTAKWKEGITGEDPKFGSGATSSWQGNNTEFNSLLYGKLKGYYHE